MINSPMFSNSLKPDDITSLLKKGRKYLKENYRPIGILPTLSKVFENIMFAQMSAFFDSFFSQNTNVDFGNTLLLKTFFNNFRKMC